MHWRHIGCISKAISQEAPKLQPYYTGQPPRTSRIQHDHDDAVSSIAIGCLLLLLLLVGLRTAPHLAQAKLHPA